ncbi:MAG: serine/threonine protein kinase, partial [Phycisphaerales bacterium]|nr:serine/threonine protein kinase [Phycisphaerales bacterium]
MSNDDQTFGGSAGDFETTAPSRDIADRRERGRINPHALAGVSIPGYEIRGVLGSGGMGVVFRAVRLGSADQGAEIEVAIKVLWNAVSDRGDRLSRQYLKERRALAVLDHSFIPTIIDAGTVEAGEQVIPYIVMELYKNAAAITTYCRRVGATLVERLVLMEKVCRTIGVAHAHETAIVHRDLKPSNVLVNEHGDPVIIDFGLAHFVGDGGDTFAPETLTRAGAGTPTYMAPEQRGDHSGRIGPRVDVYALGVMLGELVSSATPSDKPSPIGTRMTNADGLHARSQACDEVVRKSITVVIHRATRDDPEKRYCNATELADAIRQCLDDPISVRNLLLPDEAHVRGNLAAWVRGVIAVVAVSIGAVYWVQRSQADDDRNPSSLHKVPYLIPNQDEGTLK